MVSLAIVDTSWMMYKNKFSLKMLSVKRTQPSGIQIECPTGHVYGTVNDIATLAKAYDIVLMAIDSPCPARKAVLSNYKADRHSKTGDPFNDYNIYADLYNILGLTTLFKNVYYIKKENLESDDIIASWIARSAQEPDHFYLSVYHNDNDILQTPGNYSWYNNLSNKALNRSEYIVNKYKLPVANPNISDYPDKDDISDTPVIPIFDSLPEVIKLIRGDSSDKIPPSIPFFPKKWLDKLCLKYPQLITDLDDFINFLSYEARGVTNELDLSKTWREKLLGIESPDHAYHKSLKMNYTVVHPIIVSTKEFLNKKLDLTFAQISKIVSSYQLSSYFELLEDINGANFMKTFRHDSYPVTPLEPINT